MDATPRAASPALFVATDLSHFEPDDAGVYADDVTIGGLCFRRLEPPYFAWLRYRMAAAKNAVAKGRLAAASFEELRRQFNVVHAWAVEHLGEPALRAAVMVFDARTYQPPRPEDDEFAGSSAKSPSGRDGPRHRFPPSGAWPFTEPVADDAVAKIDAVREQALALGWTERGLYQNRGRFTFPYGQDYGVVCFLGAGATVAAVARDAITIQHARGNPLRFPNPDVDQPWSRRAAAGAAR